MSIDLYDTKILVTGGTGTLGNELKNYIPNAMYPSREEFDILWPTMRLRDFLWKEKVAMIIHCAAIINDKIDKEDPESMTLAFNTNAGAVASLCHACRKTDTHLFYISTDYVFDGKGSKYKETDCPNPQNFYAMTKLLGEAYVRFVGGHVIRTSFCHKDKWLFDGAYTNVYSSRDTVDVIAPLIAKVIARTDKWGQIHVGTERKSFYDLAVKIKPDVKRIRNKANKDTSFDLSLMYKVLEEE